jgi:hypothetical protein
MGRAGSGGGSRTTRTAEPTSVITPLAHQPGAVDEAVLREEGVLEAIARHFRNVGSAPWRREEGTSFDLAEDTREVLERQLARLAAGGSEK